MKENTHPEASGLPLASKNCSLGTGESTTGVCPKAQQHSNKTVNVTNEFRLDFVMLMGYSQEKGCGITYRSEVILCLQGYFNRLIYSLLCCSSAVSGWWCERSAAPGRKASPASRFSLPFYNPLTP